MEFSHAVDSGMLGDVELRRALIKVQMAQETLEEAEEWRVKARHELTELLTSRGEKTMCVNLDEGRRYRVTVVAPERTKIDEAGLRGALGARAFNKITVRKVDKKLLEQAAQQGSIDMEIVSDFTQIVKTAPYPLITKADDDEDG